MPTAKKQSDFATQATLADDDTVTGLDRSALPAAQNVNFALLALATYVLGKREAVMTQVEAEAGTVDERRGITPERLKQAIAALSIKHKVDATAAPTASNDNTQGYSAGSLWIWVSQSRVWIAKSVGTNIAAWVELTGGGPGGGLTEEQVGDLITAALEDYVTAAALTTALADYVTTTALATDLEDYATTAALTAAIAGLEIGEGAPAASQAEAEAGTETELRSFSPLRIAQAIAALAGGGMSDVVDDTTPDLGGNLNVNGHEIQSGDGSGNYWRLQAGGWVFGAGYNPKVTINTTDADISYLPHLRLSQGSPLIWMDNDAASSGNKSLVLRRAADGTLQLGLDHATAPVAQKIQGPAATSGNNNGGKVTIQGGAPSGTGARGNVDLDGADVVIVNSSLRIGSSGFRFLGQRTYTTMPGSANDGDYVQVTNSLSDSSNPQPMNFAMATYFSSAWHYVVTGDIVNS